MSATPTWAEIISEAIDSKLMDIHTALPGRIQSYDAATQTADIQLQIKRPIQDNNDRMTFEEFPILPNVPVAFPRSSSFFISFPLAQDDFVFVIFPELSTDVWRSKGSLSEPNDCRWHSLSGGVAFPCLYPNAKQLSDAHVDNMVLGKDGATQIHIKSNEIALGSESPSEYVALATKVNTALTAIQTKYDTHTHPHPMGPTSAPTPPLIGTLASVAASKVKAE